MSERNEGVNEQGRRQLVRLNRRGFVGAALGTLAAPAALVARAGSEPAALSRSIAGSPLTIARQGSLFLAGAKVSVPGAFDPNAMPMGGLDGDSYWAHQVYVHYQVPERQRGLPIVMLHGAGQTGATWESTPDGREGFQSLFLRMGHPVYTVDLPHAGRAGSPEIGPGGGLAHPPSRGGERMNFVLSRLGPVPFEYFPNSQFPRQGFDAFCRQDVPFINFKPEFLANALTELTERTGPIILFTHSNSGMVGWLAATNNAKVKGVVAFEPGGFLFPDEVPQLPPLSSGAPIPLGQAMPKPQFAQLARVPIQVVLGDNIPQRPVAAFGLDIYRVVAAAADEFVSAIRSQGGNAAVLSLPREGLSGNSHFAFSDLNNAAVAERVELAIRRDFAAA